MDKIVPNTSVTQRNTRLQWQIKNVSANGVKLYMCLHFMNDPVFEYYLQMRRKNI